MFDFNWKNKYRGYKVNLAPKEEIEAHEILLDSNKAKRDSPIFETEGGKFELPIERGIFLFLFFLISVIFSGLFVRIAYLQTANFQSLALKAWQNKTKIIPIPAQRGVIYDTNYFQLVSNAPSFDLIAVSQELPCKEEDLIELAQTLSPILQESPIIILERLRENILKTSSFLLFSNLSHDAIVFFETNDFPGLELSPSSIRKYQDGSCFAHLLGHTGKVSPEDLSNHPTYFINDYIGRMGLEAEYEEILRGQFGRKFIEISVAGEEDVGQASLASEDGKSLVLHLDAELQKKMYDVLSAQLRKIGASKAAAIALNPKNGGVLALVSLPSFDNNIFNQVLSQKDFNRLKNDPAKPLFNRAIAGVYPSGSTIKPLLAVAALEENIVSPNQSFFCSGSLFAGNREYHDWKTHGSTNLIKAIAESCNVYFYTIGGGYEKIEGLGINRIIEYLELFGWNDYLGIDLPGEFSGFLPTPAWKEKTKGERWYLGDTYNVSIGQGDIGVTPLQVAVATASIANGGKLFQPQVVDKIVTVSTSLVGHGGEENFTEDISPKIIRDNFVDLENIKIAQRGMREAVIYGSSAALSILPVEVAGKTGTAQFGLYDKTHAWWSGFAPYENPEIVLTILIEGGGGGSANAVPVAKEVLEWYYSR